MTRSITDNDHLMAKHSKHQQSIIRNYYKNKGAIGLQRLSELVTDLYLAEGKQRERVWKNITAALQKLKMSPKRIKHLVEQDNPTLIAQVVEEFMAKEA